MGVLITLLTELPLSPSIRTPVGTLDGAVVAVVDDSVSPCPATSGRVELGAVLATWARSPESTPQAAASSASPTTNTIARTRVPRICPDIDPSLPPVGTVHHTAGI